MDSATLARQISQFDQSAEDPLAVYNRTTTELGIPDARTRVTGLKTQLVNTENMLNNVEGSVTGRTLGNVSQAQLARIIANERDPIAKQYKTLGQNYDIANTDLTNLDRSAHDRADMYVSGQRQKRQSLQDQYERQLGAEKAAEEQRRYAASLVQSKASGGGGGGNKGTSMSLTQTVSAIRQGLDRVKGRDNHVAPQDLARAYNDWAGSGLDPNSFWKYFQGYWNPQQGNYKAQFNSARG